MGKNPCPVCATPEAKFISGYLQCSGCGLNVRLMALTGYLRGDRKLIGFDKATKLYESMCPSMSFGEWLIQENFELVGKP